MRRVGLFIGDEENRSKKVGFKEIGRRRQSYYLKGKIYDDVYMDILRDEFLYNHKGE